MEMGQPVREIIVEPEPQSVPASEPEPQREPVTVPEREKEPV